MPVHKLTRKGIADIKLTNRRVVYYDQDLPGFALRVERTGRMTYFIEYRPGAGGRSVQKQRFTIGTTSEFTPEEARDRARTLLAEVRLGGDPAAAKSKAKTVPTFKDFATKHLDEMMDTAKKHPEQAILRPRTIVNYRSYLKNHLGPAIGSRPLDLVARDEVKRLHDRVGKTTPTTANRCLEFVGSIYKAADLAGHVAEGTNPARGIKAFKERKRQRFLSPEELARFGNALRIAETTGVPYVPPARPGKKLIHVPKKKEPVIVDPFAAAALRVLIFSGARLREVLHARWEDIDMREGFLAVFSKTGPRTIHLSAPALEVLTGLPRTSSPYVFPTQSGERPKPDLKRPWKSIITFAGFPKVRINDLRHRFASVALKGGASLAMIGALLGHTSPITTSRYAHLAADRVRAVGEATAQAIASAMRSDPEPPAASDSA